MKYKSIYVFDKDENYHGEILGVEWVSAGRTWRAGWRASISEVHLMEDGSGLSRKDARESVTYEINRELIAMVVTGGKPLLDSIANPALYQRWASVGSRGGVRF